MGMKAIPAVEARVHFGEIIMKSFKDGERFIVEKAGIPMVVIMNAREYERIIQEREERFKLLDQFKMNLPDVSEEEIRKDVSQAMSRVRKKRV